MVGVANVVRRAFVCRDALTGLTGSFRREAAPTGLTIRRNAMLASIEYATVRPTRAATSLPAKAKSGCVNIPQPCSANKHGHVCR